MEIIFKYGFTYKEVPYGWKNRKLYRLPYIKKLRSYGLKEIPAYVFKTTKVYNVQRAKLTINRLQHLTQEVDWNVPVIESKDCPF